MLHELRGAQKALASEVIAKAQALPWCRGDLLFLSQERERSSLSHMHQIWLGSPHQKPLEELSPWTTNPLMCHMTRRQQPPEPCREVFQHLVSAAPLLLLASPTP